MARERAKLYTIEKSVLESCPEVVNIKGTRDNPKYTLYIGRSINMGGWRLSQSKWANPYPVKKYGLDESLRLYEEHLLKHLWNDLHEVAGHTLGCWCHPNKCHGDIIVKWYLLKDRRES